MFDDILLAGTTSFGLPQELPATVYSHSIRRAVVRWPLRLGMS